MEIAAEHTIGSRLAGGRLADPFLRSGLALAGANVWLRYELPPLEAGDGLLTALDVAGMDLHGTELVVLSACETALGDIRVGDGVMGLQRAFLIAGARTMVMSLWTVPDSPTCLLVHRFYQNLLRRKQRCDQALREAQLYLSKLTIADIKQSVEPSLKPVIDQLLPKLSYYSETVTPFFHPPTGAGSSVLAIRPLCWTRFREVHGAECSNAWVWRDRRICAKCQVLRYRVALAHEIP